MAERTTSRRRYYNRTGGAYEENRYADGHMEDYRGFRNETLAEILKESAVPVSARILEIGCGTGLTLRFLSELPAGYRVFGMDLSETMLRQAHEKAGRLANRPLLAIGDAGRLPFAQGLFDVVVSTRFIHQFSHDDKKRLWAEFRRVTRPGGLMVVEFYSRPYHWLRYHLGDGAKGRSPEGFFSHYPTRHQVQDIVGGPVQRYALRMPGAKLVRQVLGDSGVRAATRASAVAGGLLTDEYFVVSRNG